MQDLKITIIQSNLHWENVQKNLDMFSEKIAAVKNSDLIVLPEMFSTGFTMKSKEFAEDTNGKTVEWIRAQAKKTNAVVAGGIIAKKGNYFYNKLIWMRPDGTFEQYNKRHLFRMANEQQHYSPGNKKIIVDLKGWKVCPLVCYDLRFPVWSRNKTKVKNKKLTEVKYQYDLLIYIANWPERRNHPWKTLLQARAIENLSYVVGVNRVGNDGNEIYHSGDSAIINYKGEVISKTKAHEENIETITISYNELTEFRKSFPAGLDADSFEIL